MPVLGKLFGDKGPQVETLASGLQLPLSAGPFQFADLQLAGGKGLALLDQPVQLDAGATLKAEVLGAGATVSQIFRQEDTWTPGGGRRLAVLDLFGRLGVAGKGKLPVAEPAALSFQLNAAAEVSYRHLLALPEGERRLAALTALVGRSQIPPLVDFAALGDGEVHQWNAQLSLALGAELTIGREIAFKHDLFPGLAPEVSIDFQFAFKASVGASLYERMRWTVGRGQDLTLRPGWVRLRAERESRRRLTLGAQLALDIENNLGEVLEALLNRALALAPVEEAMAALADLDARAALVEGGKWEEIETALGKAAAERLQEFLAPVLESSPEIKKVTARAGEVVRAWQGLGETLQSFWSGMLNRGEGADGRAKLRGRLEKIAALPDDPAALLADGGDDVAGWILLLETLSGRSLEEIWLAGGGGRLLAGAKAEAKRALAFLDKLESLPDTVLGGFAERLGIAGALQWIEDNATSVEKLQAAATSRLQKLIEKLLHKAFAAIDEGDRQKLQEWAGKLRRILAAPKAIEAEIRKAFQAIQSEVGFNLAVEIDRSSRKTALLDLEFDPQAAENRALAQAIRGFAAGTFARALAALPVPEDKKLGEEPVDPPFLLRECAFTSERLRTGTASFFSTLLGGAKNVRQRRISTALAVDGRTLDREATYAGSFLRSAEITLEKSGRKSTSTFASSIGWIATVRGRGPRLTDPFEAGSAEHRLRLTISREDDATLPEELAALRRLLDDLGFTGGTPAGLAENRATRFALAIELDGAALTGFLGDGSFGADWDLDWRNAARRWYDEALVPDTAREFDLPDLKRGSVLAGLVATEDFRGSWTRSVAELEGSDGWRRPIAVVLPEGGPIQVTLVRGTVGPGVTWGNFNTVRDLVVRRKSSQRHFQAAGRALAPLAQTTPTAEALTPRAFEGFAESFAKAGEALSPGFWKSPAFALWLALSRVARSAPASLATARGIASLRHFDEAEREWSAPQTFTLDPGRLPRRGTGVGVFPLG